MDAHRRIGEALWALFAGPMDDMRREVPQAARAAFHAVYPGHVRL